MAANLEVSGGIDSTVKSIQDQTPIASALAVSTTKVGIGTTIAHEKLTVENGAVLAGTAGAPNGSLILAGKYNGNNDYLNTLSSHYSSGGTVLSYGVKAKSGSAGYVSSTSVNVPRSAINMASG
ncbi:MAG: hypothetical protein AB1633_13180, partial [Elusimicrobiota bacterium]